MIRSAMGYKVPFRQVWCDTLGRWVEQTIYCHLVLRFRRFGVNTH